MVQSLRDGHERVDLCEEYGISSDMYPEIRNQIHRPAQRATLLIVGLSLTRTNVIASMPRSDHWVWPFTVLRCPENGRKVKHYPEGRWIHQDAKPAE